MDADRALLNAIQSAAIALSSAASASASALDIAKEENEVDTPKERARRAVRTAKLLSKRQSERISTNTAGDAAAAGEVSSQADARLRKKVKRRIVFPLPSDDKLRGRQSEIDCPSLRSALAAGPPLQETKETSIRECKFDVFTVADVCGVKVRRRKGEDVVIYRLRWRGYAPLYDSEEPASNLSLDLLELMAEHGIEVPAAVLEQKRQAKQPPAAGGARSMQQAAAHPAAAAAAAAAAASAVEGSDQRHGVRFEPAAQANSAGTTPADSPRPSAPDAACAAADAPRTETAAAAAGAGAGQPSSAAMTPG